MPVESNGPPPIRAVIFDYGCVICRPPSPDEWAQFAAAAGVTIDEFVRAYPRSRERYDRGLVRAPQFWHDFGRQCGSAYDDEAVQCLAEIDIRVWTHIDDDLVSLARQLQRSGVVTGILSNMQPDLLEVFRRGTDWLDAFDVQVFSCEVGFVKPEPQIYRQLLGQLRAPASIVLFVDDVADNVEAARAAGLQAEIFTSVDDLRRRLGSTV